MTNLRTARRYVVRRTYHSSTTVDNVDPRFFLAGLWYIVRCD